MKSFLLLPALAAHILAASLPALEYSVRATPDSNAQNPQTSFFLDPGARANGFQNDGQSVAEPGQEKSLTSPNNYINLCLTSHLPITNGKQISTGSCNPAPMGFIPNVDNMPSAKFVFPPNLGKVQANKAFTVKVAIKNLATGHFTNPAQTYYSAPQQLNDNGLILGHSHIVIETLSSLGQTDATNPKQFVFFKGLNSAAQGGILIADVTNGLPKGFYRISTINSAANHQPVLAPVAQRGAMDDAAYFAAA